MLPHPTYPPRRVALFAFSSCLVFALNAHATTLLPTDDAHTYTAQPKVNFGTANDLLLGPTRSVYLKFNFDSLPAGIARANIAKATLRLWVNNDRGTGTGRVHETTASWDERSITGQEYDFAADDWKEVVPIPPPNQPVFVGGGDGFIYALGGDSASKSVRRYDPHTKVWSRLPDLPIEVTDGARTWINGSACVFGVSFAFSYTPPTGSYQQKLPGPPHFGLSTARTVYAGGSVYFQSGSGLLKYTLASNDWQILYFAGPSGACVPIDDASFFVFGDPSYTPNYRHFTSSGVTSQEASVPSPDYLPYEAVSAALENGEVLLMGNNQKLFRARGDFFKRIYLKN